MEMDQVQYILNENDDEDVEKVETYTLDETEYQDMLNKNINQAIFVKNGRTFIYQNTNEEDLGASKEELHLLTDGNDYSESVMYQVIDPTSSTLETDNDQKNITILGNNIVSGKNLEHTNVETVFIKEESYNNTDEEIMNDEEVQNDASTILTGIDDNALKQFAIIKDGKLYLHSEDDNESLVEIIADNQSINIPIHLLKGDNNITDDQVLLEVNGNNEYLNDGMDEDEDVEEIESNDLSLELTNSQPFYFVKNRIYRERDRRQKLNQKSRKNSFHQTTSAITRGNKKQKLIGKIIDIRKGTEFVENANNINTRTSFCKLNLQSDNDLSLHERDLSIHDDGTDTSNDNFTNNVAESNVESLFIDGNGKILKVITTKNSNEINMLSKEDTSYVSKTLSGLMAMISLQKKLLTKTLYVKLVEKEFNGTSEKNSKVLGYIKGCIMNDTDDTYKFIELADDVDYGIKINNEKITKKSYEESITIYKMVNASGLVSTRIIVLKNPRANQRKSLRFNDEQDDYYRRQTKKLQNYCEICSLQFTCNDEFEQHQNNTHYSLSIVLPNHATTTSTLDDNEDDEEEMTTIEFDDAALNELIRFDGDSSNDITNSQFIQQEQQQHHQQIFHCKSCDKSFNQLKDLNSHFATHDTLKTYVCDVCSREFTRYANLIRHLEIHRGGGKKFVCNICGCSYNYSASLTRHIVQNHI